jgi:hypothetical protein
MSKRRKGERAVFHQVPSLRELAGHAVAVASGRPTGRWWRTRMDTPMQEGRDASTQTGKRARTAAQEGAAQVGQGLQVTVPRAVPHSYNNNFTVRLTYADNYRHDVSYNSAQKQLFAVNSIFDPDVSGTGHQPHMRDLWASQYDYYSVLACDYEIHMYNSGVSTITYTNAGTASQRIGTVMVNLLPSTNTADFISDAAIYPIAEMKNVQTEFMPPEDTVKFVGTLTPGDFVVDAKDSDSDQTWTANGSNPSVIRYLGYILNFAQWGAIPGQNQTPYSAVQVFVKLNYTVQFTQINQSLRSVGS